MRCWCVLLLFLVSALPAQDTAGNQVYRVGGPVQRPHLRHKVDPEYSDTGRAARVEGSVVLELVVDETGRATDIGVLSPLGFGMDEQAIAAVRKWRFEPGRKDGKPVKVRAQAEVNFRFLGSKFDPKLEARRTAFNLSLSSLQRRGSDVAKAVESLRKLADEQFPPAMHLLGVMLRSGEHMPKDPERGLRLLQESAQKQYGPALYEIGRLHLTGEELPKDPEKGRRMVEEAAELGSVLAQFLVGALYEAGTEVPKNPDRALRSFRLCAASGEPTCQFRVATLLLQRPNRADRDVAQALAWYELAADKGLVEARQALERERASASPEVQKQVQVYKAQLVPKR